MRTGTTRTGGCQCGAVRYQCADTPLALYACHCTECRRQSGSAFGLSYQVARASFRLLQGAPGCWSRPTDSGGRLDCRFFPACGTRLWHEASPDAGTLTVKAGTLDRPVDLAEAIHIWTRSRLPGVAIPPDAAQFPGEPD
ncbi:MAG: GFA family protein [Tistlia sp.]|uniref:GFA family protein n=1 Tax=Tistlia sp. TaxID=3057121 RepID=UPI0034A23136